MLIRGGIIHPLKVGDAPALWSGKDFNMSKFGWILAIIFAIVAFIVYQTVKNNEKSPEFDFLVTVGFIAFYYVAAGLMSRWGFC